MVLTVPGVEPLIGSLRHEHTPGGARGIPAHVTLLFPFTGADRGTGGRPHTNFRSGNLAGP